MKTSVHTSTTLPAHSTFDRSGQPSAVENTIDAENLHNNAAAAPRSSRPRCWSPEDFLFGATIGEGAYGVVVHGQMRPSPEEKKDHINGRNINIDDPKCNFAIKIMDKTSIMRSGRVRNVLRERTILSKLRLHSDIVVRLHASFHDTHCLYLVMDLCTGGNLAGLIRWSASNRWRNLPAFESSTPKDHNDTNECEEDDSQLCMSMTAVRYYSAQLLRALECLHSLGIIHRDFKPENVMITGSGRIKLADFGAAIDTTENTESISRDCTGPSPNIAPPDDEISAASFARMSRRQRQQAENSFVGTADYVSPEILRGGMVTPSVDLWSYGCVVHAMMVGESPFHGSSDYTAMNSIMAHANGTESQQMQGCIPRHAGNFVSRLLVPNPSSRLGAQDDLRVLAIKNSAVKGLIGCYHSIRSHAFFEGVEWGALERDDIEPPIVPPKPKWVCLAEDRTLTMMKGGSLDLRNMI